MCTVCSLQILLVYIQLLMSSICRILASVIVPRGSFRICRQIALKMGTLLSKLKQFFRPTEDSLDECGNYCCERVPSSHLSLRKNPPHLPSVRSPVLQLLFNAMEESGSFILLLRRSRIQTVLSASAGYVKTKNQL